MPGSPWRGPVSLYFSRRDAIFVTERREDKKPPPYSIDTIPQHCEVTFDEFFEILTPEPSLCSRATCLGSDCPEKRGEFRWQEGATPWPFGEGDDPDVPASWSPGIAVGSRSNENVKQLSLVTFDIEGKNGREVTLEDLAAIRSRLISLGLAFIIQSTHNHNPPNDCRVRVVIAPSRLILPIEWEPLLRVVVAKCIGVPVDEKTFPIHTHFYTTKTKIDVEFINEIYEGELLDVDAMLVGVNIEEQRAPLVKPSAPIAPAPQNVEVDMAELRHCFSNYRPKNDKDGHKKECLRRVLAGKPLAEKGSRDHLSMWIGTIMAWAFPVGTPTDAALEFVRPSIALMQSYQGDDAKEGFDFWMDKARHHYESAAALRHAMQGEWEAQKAKDKELKILAREKFGIGKKGQTAPADDISVCWSDDNDGPPSAGTRVLLEALRAKLKWEPYQDLWENLLLYNEDGTQLLNDEANAEIILTYSPEWKNTFRLNVVLNIVEVSGNAPISDVSKISPNILPTAVRNWLAGSEYGLRLPKVVIREQIAKIARENSYDPLRDYLLAIEWDGISRLYTFLEKYCNASTVDMDGRDITDYVRKVSLRWPISAVARGLSPGCKVDTVLVIDGEGGVRKTTMFETLAGEWYGVAQHNIVDKDSQMQATRRWIIEMGELASISNAKVDALKSFLTVRQDSFRPPYTGTVEDFPRRSVYVGTTNDPSYLRDETGNRRFWPVHCGDINVEALKRDRDQLWAEAVVRFQAGEEWWFDKADNVELEKINIQHLDTGTFADSILGWWRRKPLEKRVPFSILDVATGALQMQVDKIPRQSVARALKALDFEQQGKHRPRLYHATAERIAKDAILDKEAADPPPDSEPVSNVVLMVRGKHS